MFDDDDGNLHPVPYLDDDEHLFEDYLAFFREIFKETAKAAYKLWIGLSSRFKFALYSTVLLSLFLTTLITILLGPLWLPKTLDHVFGFQDLVMIGITAIIVWVFTAAFVGSIVITIFACFWVVKASLEGIKEARDELNQK